jgi:hypothetical protein
MLRLDVFIPSLAQLGQDPFAYGRNMINSTYWCQSIFANLSRACYLTTFQSTPIGGLCRWNKLFFLHALLEWNDSFNCPGDHIFDIETLSLHWSFIPSCISCCWANWPFELAWWSHSPHGNFIPWCIYLCCWVKWSFVGLLYSHSLHGLFFPSCIGSQCQVRSPLEVALKSHSLHGYLFTSCNIRWCWVRLHFKVAWMSHCFHGFLPICVLR